MSTISNQLAASAFISNPDVPIVPSSNAPIQLDCVTSPEIKLVAGHKPGKTPNPRKLDSLTVFPLPADSTLNNWRLKSVIVIQLRRARKQWLATTWLEGVAEYGTGETDSEAITDLVVSLGEYRESLEKREEKLGNPARNELKTLRNLIERLHET